MMESFRESSSSRLDEDCVSCGYSNQGILEAVQKEAWYQQPCNILVIGASGDLAKKKTYPALLELWESKLLPQQKTRIYGFARTPHSDEAFRRHVSGFLRHGASDFLEICTYHHGKSYGDTETLRNIFRNGQEDTNWLVYLAIPPYVFAEAAQAVRDARPGVKVILEKPFGRDTTSCARLLTSLSQQGWREDALYRIDHYLGKEMVQNILVVRRYNRVLEQIWNRQHVDHVHLVFKEPFGTEGRGGYFDPYGIIRDIIQNHLPHDWQTQTIRDAKVTVLEQIPIVEPSDVLVGQYEGYKDDTTIQDKTTVSPTYALVKLAVNAGRWQGVPFLLEAGKALDERICEARLVLKDGNQLVLRLQPNPTIFLTTTCKSPGYANEPVSTALSISYSRKPPEAYAKLVLDCLRGKQENFVRDDELLAAWKIFTPFLDYQEATKLEPLSYVPGSAGPAQRSEFLSTLHPIPSLSSAL